MKRAQQHRWLIPASAVYAVLLAASTMETAHSRAQQQQQAGKLPIYRLAAPKNNAETIRGLASKMFTLKQAKITSTDDRLIIQSGAKVVEVHKGSGGVWAADEGKL